MMRSYVAHALHWCEMHVEVSTSLVMLRYEIMEIKHGRAAMLGFLHVIAIEAGVRLPGYLSVSQDLKFSDVPAGCFASLEAVPTAGWLQIMVRSCRRTSGVPWV